MTPDAYRQAADLFERFRELPGPELRVALDSACAGNAELRACVLRLLEADRRVESDSFLNRRAIEDAARILTPQAPRLPEPGTVIGHYRLGVRIAAGGMGVVYEGQDLRLDRRVAIKILPSPLAGENEESVQRFHREARAVILLNHPHIVSIFDADFDQGYYYIATEFIEGKTLRQLIASELHRLGLQAVLDLLAQAASALSAAHEADIVHRDIKPENIMVRPDGIVKVLDFGLAKLRERSDRPSDRASELHTQPGHVVGTMKYLSPEQVEGRPVDARSDLFNLGIVAYEMATGRRPFDGPLDGAVLDAILHHTPAAPSSIRPELDAEFDDLVLQALEKDPELRFQSASDLRSACKRLSRNSSRVDAVVIAPKSSMRPMALTLAGVLAAIIVTLAVLYFRESSPEPQVLKYKLQPPEKAAFETIALSPDGRLLAFTGREDEISKLWVQPLNSLTAKLLAGADGATFPFWSPDSRFIGFFADGKLKKIEASGGPPQTLCEAPQGRERGGSWNRDGVILFGIAGRALQRVQAEGGVPKAAVEIDRARPGSPRFPFFLPDGRHFLYVDRGADRATETGIHIGRLDSRERIRLLSDFSSAAYAAAPSGGFVLFWRGGTLMAQSFDAGKLRLSGGPFPVADQVGYNTRSAFATFSVSQNGALITAPTVPLRDMRWTWFDRAGKRLGIVDDAGRLARPALSADGTRLALDRMAPLETAAAHDIWLTDLARNVSTRFTFNPGSDIAPVWSPDGRLIAISSIQGGRYNLYRKIASGAGKDELLLKTGNSKYPVDWSPNDRFLLYEEFSEKSKFDLMLLPDPGIDRNDRKPEPFLQTQFNEYHGAFSPDGKWIAYDSDESGRDEAFVQPFPKTGAKWQVSKGGGSHPKWRRDGKELFYLNADFKITAVEVTTGATFQAGAPRPLFDIDAKGRFVVTRDGQRFLALARQGAETAINSPATIVINWMAGIKR